MSLPAKVSKKGSFSEWECAVCMSDPKEPKLLPCAHTFCMSCLEGIVRNQPAHNRRNFNCPVCRESIAVPPQGVKGFKNNFYIKSEKRAGVEDENTWCPNHPESERRQLELYCLNCNWGLCWKCKNTHHLNHRTEEVSVTAERIRGKLQTDKNKLQKEIDGLKARVDRFQEEHRQLREKRTAVKKDIERRYMQLFSMISKSKEEALLSLDTATASIESQLLYDDLERTVIDLERLHQRMVMGVSEQGASLLLTAHGIYRDAESLGETVRKMNMKEEAASRNIARPTLRHFAAPNITAEVCKHFLGSVERTDMKSEVLLAKVKLQLHSWEGERYDIFSLLPESDGVYVAFDDNPLHEDPQIQPKRLTLDGKGSFRFPGGCPPSYKGRMSFARGGKGKCSIDDQGYGTFVSYARSRSLVMLKNGRRGSADVIVKPLNDLDFIQSMLTGMSIANGVQGVLPCGPHRSFDIHSMEPVVAVVEEASSPTGQRSVIMFINGRRGVYQPPVSPYNPSDVCFYKLG